MIRASADSCPIWNCGLWCHWDKYKRAWLCPIHGPVIWSTT